MQRTLISNLKDNVGQEVLIQGWVSVRRDQGKMVFFDFRDRSGSVQGVVLPQSEAIETAKEVRTEYIVTVEGMVNKRPEKNINPEMMNGQIELEVKKIQIITPTQELPFERNVEVNLETLLDYRPYTLRSDRAKDIFTVQASIVEAYRQSLRGQGFVEFQAPAIVGGDAEGGAAVFKLEYFAGNSAFLATSPQFYKQIMMGAFERSFTIARIFRAEKSATTRHLSEITQMDYELGFIKDHREVMTVLENVIKHVAAEVSTKHSDIFKRFNVELPLAPEHFPSLKLTEAQEIIEKHFSVKAIGEDDMTPEHERLICEWAKKEHDSDFVFITHFPTAVRAFYTYEDADEAPYSRGFDLLFRGLEINSGSQRIHEYDQLVERIRSRGLDPEKFAFYLQAFKYGMPPHGGSSTGLERLTARMLNLANVKEATAFPRDMNRIDSLLSAAEKKEIETERED